MEDLDDQVRAAAFLFLRELKNRTGGFVTRSDIAAFTFQGRPFRLIPSQTGIWKPSGFEAALSFVTKYAPRPELRPYDDHLGDDGYPRYKWRGTDRHAFDNVGLRRAMELGKPMTWFVGVAHATYDPLFPVWLTGEEPHAHQFVVALDDVMRDQWTADLSRVSSFDPSRRYADVMVRSRLHQPAFRRRVLVAYQMQCALCRLRHRELLDAAHIKEDADGGEPVVPNGVAMCAIHHRAFDTNVLGIRPDYKVEIRSDVLVEQDGPTLLHALQGVHGQLLVVPRSRVQRPDPDLLEERYERFRAAG